MNECGGEADLLGTSQLHNQSGLEAGSLPRMK